MVLNAVDAGLLKVSDGGLVRVIFAESDDQVVVPALLSPELPERVALIPRSFGIPISGPRPIEVRSVERVTT